jgi:DNA-binding NarL/FixJ family response regulator
MTIERIRILIADDHPLFRKGIRETLELRPDIEVVGEATNGEEAVELAENLQPDVILMDITMPGIPGIEATRRIVRTSPHIAILMVTMAEDDNSVFAAMQAGARGYLLKGAGQEDLLRAVEAVAKGEAIFSPAVAQRLMTFFANGQHTRRTDVFPELTAREVEILTLIAKGLNNTEIANQLVLQPKTVRNHISNIFAKLQVADRAQAIIRARDAGLG